MNTDICGVVLEGGSGVEKVEVWEACVSWHEKDGQILILSAIPPWEDSQYVLGKEKSPIFLKAEHQMWVGWEVGCTRQCYWLLSFGDANHIVFPVETFTGSWGSRPLI